MTIVHSFWSKPALYGQCGFPAKYNFITYIYCYALSCIRLKQLGHRVVFYGDDLSLKLFNIIPYDEMRLLNIPNEANPIFQSLGKIYALQQMKEDEVYMSGDVIFKNNNILSIIDQDHTSDIVVQSIQYADGYPYDDVCNKIEKHLKNGLSTNFYNDLKIVRASRFCDTSVIKFNNKMFKDLFIICYKENINIINKQLSKSINVDLIDRLDLVFEKQFLYQLSRKYNITVNPLLGVDINEVRTNAMTYEIMHILMSTKIYQLANVIRELRLADFDLYNKISEFCDTIQIPETHKQKTSNKK